ncbi:catechol 2,3-dioxygenase [Rubrobacter taiwanensis]|uniref:Catechol 2,3-dioxygenase n=1 Tax=Rubrobacter taiwanensis TaxID=185139 RepID=A0A4R1B465_9ACTN|nr:catechol 2,3-dioxygenase [Rubrobacter taiwanensis]TCJ12711.1 catechol 2,3-dioxygenase [Rubrobacter taiwanensis]
MDRRVREPIYDIAHLGHVELLTPAFDESLWFFTEVLGMEEVARRGGSAYLRAFGDYALYTLKLTAADRAGLGHIAWRATSPAALERRAASLEESGLGEGWVEGDLGHGPAYRFADPDGHRMEIYYKTEKYRPPEDLRPALKNQPQKFPARGVGVRRLDHVNLKALDIDANSGFLRDRLGFRLTEEVRLDDGRQGAAWMNVTQKSYDIAYGGIDAAGIGGRLHHVAYALDSREYVLRAADIFLEEGIFIEAGPAKHAVQQTFFLYVYEPGGNRVEMISDIKLLLDPDHETVTWTQAEREKGQAWRTIMPESFFTYATPLPEEAPDG